VLVSNVADYTTYINLTAIKRVGWMVSYFDKVVFNKVISGAVLRLQSKLSINQSNHLFGKQR
jgi:hypothetical protein